MVFDGGREVGIVCVVFGGGGRNFKWFEFVTACVIVGVGKGGFRCFRFGDWFAFFVNSDESVVILVVVSVSCW